VTKVAARLARLEAAVPVPTPVQAFDPGVFTPAQVARMAEIQPRYAALGLAGLTDEELEDLAQIAEAVRGAPGPAGDGP